MTSSTQVRPVISAWSAVSGFGIGKTAFGDGLAAGTSTATTLDTEQWHVPSEQACVVPGFDIRGELGRKGTRSMDRATALAVCTVGKLLGDEVADRDTAVGDGAALVLGTTTGSAASIMDFTRDSLEGEKPFFVDPARFPNTVMNCAAGQCAIWYELRGPNATVAGGRLAGLHALNYASRLLRTGRARTVLCGAVEEHSHAREWLEHHSRKPEGAAGPLGEGCAIMQVSVEPSDGLAEVLAVRFGVFADGDAAGALTTVVKGALAAAGVDADDLWAVAPCAAPGELGAAEATALDAVLAGAGPRRIVPSAQLGDTAAAAAALQITAVLSAAERDAAGPGRIALITAVDREGAVGCALLRLLA